MSGHHQVTEVDPASVTISAKHGLWAKLPIIFFCLSGIGIGLTLMGGFKSHEQIKQFYFSYLTAFLFWLSIGLGGLFFVLVQHAARAGWSVIVRRMAETLIAPLALFAVLFIPVALGAHDLFHWTHAEAVAKDPILQHKAAYLNLGRFYTFAAIYFVIWGGFGFWFFKRSTQQDKSGDRQLTRKMQIVSGPALLLYALTVTYAAVDWIMSLEPHWYSTMFGVYYFAGSVVGMFAVLTLIAMAARRAKVTADLLTVEHFHDLGKLLFAFTVFWAYIAFSQYMLIWYANIPEETAWYAQRWPGAWRKISVMIAVGHFVVPFFFLMTRITKRARLPLILAALWMMVIHWVDVYWLVMPTLHPETVHLGLTDLGCTLAIGGLYLGFVTWLWRKHPLIPVKDPRLAESAAFENF